MRNFTFFSLVMLLLATVAQAQELVPLSGKPIPGKIVAVTEQNLTFQSTGDGPPLIMPLKEVGAIDFKTPVPAMPKDKKFDELELTDNSLVRLTQLKITGKLLSYTTPIAIEGLQPPKVTLPLSSVFWYMRNADDAANRAEFQTLLKGRGKRDLFVVKSSNGLNPIAGTLIEGTDTGDRVQFEREDGQKVTLPLSRASGGIIFNQPARDVIAPTLCKVIDVFGNVFYAAQVSVIGESVKVRTVSGADVEYASFKAISKLDFSQGNLLYLSDQSPTIDYSPADKDGILGEQLSFQPQVQNDKAVFTPEILLDGKKYTKGVSIPRGTTVTYKLDGTFREFKSTVGILDGNNRETWMLKLVIEVDGRIVFNEAIAKKEKAKTLGLNVKDAKELKITVETLGEGQGDQINLAEARLQK